MFDGDGAEASKTPIAADLSNSSWFLFCMRVEQTRQIEKPFSGPSQVGFMVRKLRPTCKQHEGQLVNTITGSGPPTSNEALRRLDGQPFQALQ
jgi:hypothetical protein